MAQYYYDKYNLKLSRTKVGTLYGMDENSPYDAFQELYPNITSSPDLYSRIDYENYLTVKDNTGVTLGQGRIYWLYEEPGGWGNKEYFFRFYDGVDTMVFGVQLDNRSTCSFYLYGKDFESKDKLKFEPGSLIQSNIIAEDGTYPTGGIHTDGYWYVRKQALNTAPSTPGTFTQPTGNLEIGDSKVFTVGSSTDAEANLSKYIWEVSINNGAFSKVGETQSPSFTYTIPTATSLKMRVKAVDSGGLESGYRDSNVYTVTKPKYYWSKYNTSNIFIGWNDYAVWHDTDHTSVYYPSLFKSYYHDSDTNKYVGTGGMWTEDDTFPSGSVGYMIAWGDKVERFISTSTYPNIEHDIASCTNDFKLASENTKAYRYEKGSLVQSGIVADEGTYPLDGRHSDGFWYVRGSRVNQSIAPPGAFTIPAPGAILLPGQQLTVTGANSTATNIAQHIIEASYDDGKTFTVLGTPLTNSIAYTVPADKTKKTVVFRSRAKNTSNVYSDYVYSEAFTIQHNLKPTLTLATEDNKTFNSNDILALTGEAKDLDVGNSVTVKYQINDEMPRNIDSYISDGTPHAYTKNLVYKDKQIFDGEIAVTGILAEGMNHVLKVWASDGDDNSDTQTRYFKVVHNRGPEIIAEGNDLGLLDSPPKVTYRVSDPDGDSVTVTEKLDGVVVKTFTAEPNTDYVLTLTHLQWLQVTNGEHELTITAEDSKGMATVRPFTFSRNETRIELQSRVPFVTDIAASRILITPDWTIPAGATVKVEACNNGFDAEPTWEDLTNFVKQNRGFSFTNKTKTAEQWGVNIRLTLDKGTATSEVILSGIGGAFD